MSDAAADAAAPGEPPKNTKHRLPGGLTGNALLTALIATVVAGLISFAITNYQVRDAARQAHAAQVADGASQIESAAENYYDAALSLYEARRQRARREHPGGTVPPGCPPGTTAIVEAEAVLNAAYANTSDKLTDDLLAAFSIAAHDDLALASTSQAAFLPKKMITAFYPLIRRCGQLIQGR